MNSTNFFLIGDVENRAGTLFNIPPSVKCRVRFVSFDDVEMFLVTADQQLASLEIWSEEDNVEVILHLQMFPFV